MSEEITKKEGTMIGWFCLCMIISLIFGIGLGVRITTSWQDRLNKDSVLLGAIKLDGKPYSLTEIRKDAPTK